MGFFDSINEGIANSPVGKYFQLKERGSTFTTELRAGSVTFLTMAYILAVNAAIVADTAGPCTEKDCTGAAKGTIGCRFDPFDDGFQKCKDEVRRSMATATAASSFVACWLMAILGNLPFALAPGMGINAFFTYTVVGFAGVGGMITYKQAVAAVFIEGWIFFILSISGLRHRLVRAIPKCIMLSTGGGIGMFLAFIGFQGSQGIGMISFEPATLVTLGGCRKEDRARMYIVRDDAVSSVCGVTPDGQPINLLGSAFPASPNYACSPNTMKMRSPTTWLGIWGGVLMVLLMARGFRGAIMGGILFVTFISWIPDHGASFFDDSPLGKSRRNYFEKVVVRPDTSKTDLEMDFSAFGKAELWSALISFLYLDFLDTTGTFFSVANYMNKKMGGRFINPITKEFPRINAAFCCDALATVVGGILGIPPLTTYIESATGAREGGRTGITALMVGFYFFIAMFFTPIFASIPGYATGPALILVGAMMMENVLDIEWKDPQQAIPAFLTIALIPLTYSIAYGIISGLCFYITLYIIFLAYDIITAPLTGKSVSEILKAAKPDAFMTEEELIAQEQARKLRIAQMDEEDATVAAQVTVTDAEGDKDGKATAV